MFGYVRPLRQELKVKDWEDYQAAYCGLCHSLKRRCGFAARFTLNYDFVFLALLLDDGAPREVCRRRCAAHPLGGRACLDGDKVMDLCAEECVILTRWKLRDGAADEGFWKGLGYGLAGALLSGAYRRARRRLPDFDAHIAACLGELDALERAGSAELDRAADAFARLLAGAAPGGGDPGRDRPMAQLLYHLGRWIYLADGADDLAEDRAKGRYNPIAARFGGTPDLEYLNTTMSHSLALCQSAFQLLPRTKWSDLLENILYLGLPHVQRLALEGKWSGQDKKTRSMRT